MLLIEATMLSLSGDTFVFYTFTRGPGGRLRGRPIGWCLSCDWADWSWHELKGGTVASSHWSIELMDLQHRRDVWIVRRNRWNFQPAPHSKVCSPHFTQWTVVWCTCFDTCYDFYYLWWIANGYTTQLFTVNLKGTYAHFCFLACPSLMSTWNVSNMLWSKKLKDWA